MAKSNKKAKKAIRQIELTHLIQELKRQLKAQVEERGDDYEPLFRIKNATIEANVSIGTTIGTEGSMNFYLTKIGASAAQSSGATFKIAIKLEPLDENAEELIAGQP